MSPAFAPREVARLASAAIDGALTDDDLDRLESVLLANPDARKLYYCLIDLHIDLAWELGERNRTQCCQPMTLPATETSISVRTARRSPVLGFLTAVSNCVPGGDWVLGSLVVSVVVAAFLGLASAYYRELGKCSPAARIVASEDARWTTPPTSQKSEITNQKSEITSGESLVLASGIVELKLKQGVELVIAGPAEWSIDGENDVTLTRGKLAASVPEPAIGFTVKTPTANIVDLGTEFGVEVDSQGIANVEVFRGLVEMHSHASDPLLLTAGQAGRVESGSLRLAYVNPERFATVKRNPLRDVELDCDGDFSLNWDMPKCWSNHRPPSPQFHYHVGRTKFKRLRTPMGRGQVDFAGGPLTIHTTGELAIKRQGRARVNDLRLAGGAIYVWENLKGDSQLSLAGKVSVELPSGLLLNGCRMTLACQLEGPGSLHVVGPGAVHMNTDSKNFQGNWRIDNALLTAVTFGSLGSGNVEVVNRGNLDVQYRWENPRAALSLGEGCTMSFDRPLVLGAVRVADIPLEPGTYTHEQLTQQFSGAFRGKTGTLTIPSSLLPLQQE